MIFMFFSYLINMNTAFLTFGRESGASLFDQVWCTSWLTGWMSLFVVGLIPFNHDLEKGTIELNALCLRLNNFIEYFA